MPAQGYKGLLLEDVFHILKTDQAMYYFSTFLTELFRQREIHWPDLSTDKISNLETDEIPCGENIKRELSEWFHGNYQDKIQLIHNPTQKNIILMTTTNKG